MRKIQIDSILLEKTSLYSFNHGEGDLNNKIFSKIKLINFFIGQNNTGKSQFLRSIYHSQFEGFYLNWLNKETLERHFGEWKKIITDYYFQNDQMLKENYLNLFKKLSTNQGHIERIEPTKKVDTIGSSLVSIKHRLDKILKAEFGNIYPNKKTPSLKEGTDKIDYLLNELDGFIGNCDDPKVFGNKQYYIPTLRGLRRFVTGVNDIINEDLYANLTLKEYFGGLSENNKVNEIFTGYGFYSDLKQLLLGEIEGRELVKEFQDFLSESFFDGKKITLIPREGKSKDNFKVIIKIGDVEERPIHLVGDGLQQLIIILFPIFTNKERCLFFIEEPDLFMHPGMQKALVKAMLEHDQHQYFITTHSNHIIDYEPNLYDVATFHFSKKITQNPENQKPEEKFIVKYCSGDNYAVMQDIGVKPSSVLLSNCTIWVEGITDRLYIKAYLSKYLKDLDTDNDESKKFTKDELNKIKSFKEDYHYSFIEYQGAVIDHWDFETAPNEVGDKIKALKVCSRPFFVADNDASKYKVMPKIKTDLGESAFYFTIGKEIENMVSDIILKGWLKEFDTKMKLDPKNIEKIMESEYFNLPTGMGKYLNETLVQKGFTSKDTETTLKSDYKRKLSEFAFRYIKDEIKNPNSTFKLNTEQNILCEKIIRHVLLHNKV